MILAIPRTISPQSPVFIQAAKACHFSTAQASWPAPYCSARIAIAAAVDRATARRAKRLGLRLLGHRRRLPNRTRAATPAASSRMPARTRRQGRPPREATNLSFANPAYRRVVDTQVDRAVAPEDPLSVGRVYEPRRAVHDPRPRCHAPGGLLARIGRPRKSPNLRPLSREPDRRRLLNRQNRWDRIKSVSLGRPPLDAAPLRRRRPMSEQPGNDAR